MYAIISINRFRFIWCFAVSLFGIDYLLIPTLVELHFKSIGGNWNTIWVRLSVWICYDFVWLGSNSVWLGFNSVWLGLASYNLAVAPYKFTLNPYDSALTPYDLTPTLQNKCVSNLQFISKMLILIDVGFKLKLSTHRNSSASKWFRAKRWHGDLWWCSHKIHYTKSVKRAGNEKKSLNLKRNEKSSS